MVFGAGGMARCVLDVIDAINLDQSGFGSARFEVIGCAATPAPDAEAKALLAARGVSYLGPAHSVFDRLPHDVRYVVGIGSPVARHEIDSLWYERRRPTSPIIHPNVHTGFDVEIGDGSVICSHVSIENHVRIGQHVHINQNATIGHDSVLEKCVTVSPLVAVSGNVTLGQRAFLGTGASVREKTTVGFDAVVGMGAAVVCDVEPRARVKGVPAA